MDYNKAIMEFLAMCPSISDVHVFLPEASAGKQSFFRLSNGSIRKYVDGREMKYIDCSIAAFSQAAAECYQSQMANCGNDENIQSYARAEKIISWIMEQTPPFSIKMECLPNCPTIAGVDNSGLIKYLVNVRFIYYE